VLPLAVGAAEREPGVGRRGVDDEEMPGTRTPLWQQRQRAAAIKVIDAGEDGRAGG
jgi:hypothetical protein